MLERSGAYIAALRRNVNRNIILLTLTSLFADISTEMMYPALPLFLTTVLLTPVSALGVIEGVAEGVQYAIQGPVGSLADRLPRKKPLGAIGYALAALGKSVIGLAPIWPVAFVGRTLDRLGAGSRSAPRDALIAASADKAHQGLAFGLEGVGDHAGAFVGPLITLFLVSVLRTPLRGVFLLAFAPGAVALGLFLLVRERRQQPQALEASPPRPAESRAPYGLRTVEPSYWRYLLVTGLFGIGNSTNAFLILRLEGIGATLVVTLLVYACFNLVAALISTPAGTLADSLGGPKWALFGCLLLFAAVYVGFALSVNAVMLALLFVGYGVYQGGYRALGKTYAARLVPPTLKASGLGWYATVIGLTGVVASSVGGWLWTQVSPEVTFLYGAALALAASVALVLLMPGAGATAPGVGA